MHRLRRQHGEGRIVEIRAARSDELAQRPNEVDQDDEHRAPQRELMFLELQPNQLTLREQLDRRGLGLGQAEVRRDATGSSPSEVIARPPTQADRDRRRDRSLALSSLVRLFVMRTRRLLAQGHHDVFLGSRA